MFSNSCTGLKDILGSKVLGTQASKLPEWHGNRSFEGKEARNFWPKDILQPCRILSKERTSLNLSILLWGQTHSHFWAHKMQLNIHPVIRRVSKREKSVKWIETQIKFCSLPYLGPPHPPKPTWWRRWPKWLGAVVSCCRCARKGFLTQTSALVVLLRDGLENSSLISPEVQIRSTVLLLLIQWSS